MKTASSASKCRHQNHKADIWYDDGHLVKIDIVCEDCGHQMATVRGIRNQKDPSKSCGCMKFPNETYYCGLVPMGEQVKNDEL